MPRITINYEEHEDQLVPVRMVVYFGTGKIKWDKRIYIPLEAPFERQRTEDYDSEVMSVTITQGDMILDLARPTHFGIYFGHVVDSIEALVKKENEKPENHDNPIKFNYGNVGQLVIYTADIAEVMQMSIRDYFEWR